MRKRRARFAESVAEFVRLRDDPEALFAFLKRLAASNEPVWTVASAAARNCPLRDIEQADAEKAMIAQAVAPHLAGMTPGSVKRRHALGEEPC